MSRDPHKLKVFRMADDLAVEVYRLTGGFPPEERYELRLQMRRGAVSVPANIVEGCARETLRDYLHFLNIALGSASEVRYFVRLALRLELLEASAASRVTKAYDELIRALQAAIRA